MPPEPLPPWDRKEFFRERKHERSDNMGPSVARWRDSSHHASRDLNRWGSSDFRRPIGHGKQGGWHFFPDESHHGYVSSRSGEKVVEDENFRPFPRGEGRYGRNSRDNRGSYNHNREWRSYPWETNNGFSNAPVRAHDASNELKSREDATSYSSHSNGGFGTTWDQIRPKEQHDKTSGSNGFGVGQKCEGEDSTGLNDWKPIKWTRTGSLSSRGSGFSHLSSSKSIGALESSEPKVESETKNATPVQSPSGDANACVTSAAASEETTSRKKPRLGWGEGLAKYEKKKVDGPEVTSSKDGAGSASGNVESCHPIGSSLVDKSPRMMSFSDCASPATPSSVACSSSPGLEEKSFGKTATTDNDIYNLCGSPDPVLQEHSDEGLSFNLEKLDPNSMAKMSTLLSELLRSDDPNSDSSYIKATAMNKVLILKGNISKNLEVTESEIDQLETELKSLNSILGASYPSASISLPLEDNAKSCSTQDEVKNPIPRPAQLQIASSGEAGKEKLHGCNGDKEEISVSDKDIDVDSPGTVTSKLVEPLSLTKASFSYTRTPAPRDSRFLFTGKKVQDSVHGSAFRDPSTLPVCEKAAIISNSLVLCSGIEVTHRAISLSNKELAAETHGVFSRVLPRSEYKLNIASLGNASSSQSYLSVKEKLAIRKRFVKFKERVITLKFKAFQHLWKEDMRLLSIRKHRVKSQKKFELSLRSLHNGYQKHRSSIRSRFSSPAGSISLVPTTEVINYTGKLLLDSRVKLYRDTLKMPALILDKNEKIALKFISNNGLVEDPCAVEKGRAIMNPWTPAEKEVFMEKFAVLGKDFKKIASFLDHKTTADCVEFYYKNHKSDSFEKKKKLDTDGNQEKSFSSRNYLMSSGKKWNREKNAASLEILGAASVMAANADSYSKGRQACSGRMVLAGCSESRASCGDDGTAERSSNFDFAGNDREAAAADVLAGICVSLSSEAMSSCITSSVDPVESFREWKSQKFGSVTGRPFTSQNGDDETCSDESCGEMDSTDWTDEEKLLFVQAVSSYGRDFSKIARCVRTRSRDQCKVFFSKAKKCLGLDRMHPGSGNERTSVGDDANGSGSGSDGACALEVGSGVCSDDKSDSKMDEDLPLLPTKLKQEVPDATETTNSETALSRLEGKNEGALLVVVQKANVGGYEACGFDSCQTWVRPNVVSDGDSNIVNGADDHSEMMPVNESESVLVGIAAEMKATTELEVDEKEPTVKSDDRGLGSKTKELDEKGDESRNVESGSPRVLQESNLAQLAAAVSSCSGFSQDGDCQLPASLEEPISKDKGCSVLLANMTCLVSASSVLADSGSTQSDKNGTQDKMPSSVDIRETKDGCQLSVCRDESIKNGESSSQMVVRVYPSQLSIQEEMNGDRRNRKHCSDVENRLNLDQSSDSRPFTTQSCFLKKCSNSKPLCPMTEFPLMSQSPKAHSQSLSDSEKSSRNGDVKLFGKILSNPLTTPKENLSLHENNEEKEGNHHVHKPSNKSSILSNLCSSDGSSTILKFDSSSYLGLENVQMRSSYAYLDANRLPAFPSIPVSDILLARYPDAFSNFPTPSSKLDQPQQPIAKTAERSSVSSNGNGMVDYQVYKSWDSNTKVQPFTVDVKSRQDVFSDMQRRNGIEALASFRGPGRGRISDPVAALKLHFAKAEQFGGGQGSDVVREDNESWRGNADVGR